MRAGEETRLLKDGCPSRAPKTAPNDDFSFAWFKHVAGIALGVLLGLMLAQTKNHHGRGRLNRFHSNEPISPNQPPLMSTNSKYTDFQALNFQLYTGGAPVLLNRTTQGSFPNPECIGLEKNIGVDVAAGTKQCYLGNEDVALDVANRLAIMYDAVEKAYEQSIQDPNVLKIFVAPEFFFRGQNGAYRVDDESDLPLFQDDENGDCQAEICMILSGLENFIADARFEDWLFLFGTVVVAEPLPVEDEFDYLFYNFGLLFKGYDPSKESYHGKRFLVPKRYVSTSDFLHPETKMVHTREILDATQSQNDREDPELYVPLRKIYDRKLWHTYKHELEKLDYIMIEYGWFMLDGLSFTVEICLDHDLRTALTAFLVDSVLPSPTLIPSSRNGMVEYVDIPRYQAQISLVASAGMTVSEASVALVDQGSIILQDGQEDAEPEMTWAYECFKYQWQFVGGSEVVQRNATMTPTEVMFHYNVNTRFQKHNIYGDDWKTSLRGVFSAVRYEPVIRAFASSPIARVF